MESKVIVFARVSWAELPPIVTLFHVTWVASVIFRTLLTAIAFNTRILSGVLKSILPRRI